MTKEQLSRFSDLEGLRLHQGELTMWLSQKLKINKDYESDYHEQLIKLITKRSPFIDLLEQIRTEQTSAIETYLKLRIRRRPFYLPNFLWKFILSKLVYMEYFKVTQGSI